MRTYELTLIIRPSLKDADKKKLLDTVKSWIKDFKITKEEDWGQKPLAYVIKREMAGHYYQWFLETDAAFPKDLDQRLTRNESVIRHLLIRTK